MKIPSKQILFVVALLGLPVGAYFWVFLPANTQLANQRQEIQAKVEKLDDLNAALCRVKDLDDEVMRLTQAVEFFEDKLPAQHETYKVLAQIATISSAHQLETRLFETQRTKPFARYAELPIKMELHGNFEAFYQFLLKLEQMPRITRVKDMQLTHDEKTGELTAKLTLSIYFESVSAAG